MGATSTTYPLDSRGVSILLGFGITWATTCLLYTSDAADERSSVDLGGRRIIKKKNRARVAFSRVDVHDLKLLYHDH